VEKKKVTAIVPMRHNSERVKGKNYRDFNGKPLYHHIIETLLSTKAIEHVVIDTDSDFILEDASKFFPTVQCLKRPKHLQDGAVPMNDVLLNTVRQVPSDFYLQTHSTNPLLKSETVEAAIQYFLEQFPICDSLFGVTRLQTRLWDSLGRAVNHNPNILLRTQDLPPIFEENSCFYVFTQKTLKEKHNRIGDRPFLWEVSKKESIDIDEEIDFKIAELMAQQL